MTAAEKKEEKDQRCSPLVRMLHLRLRETTVVCQSPLMPIEGGEEEEEEEGPRQCQCSELEFSTAGWVYPFLDVSVVPHGRWM